MTPRIVTGMGLDLNSVNTSQTTRNSLFRDWAGAVIAALQSAGVAVKVQWEGGATSGVYLLPLSARLTFETAPGYPYTSVLSLYSMDFWGTAAAAAKQLISNAKFQAARQGGPSTYVPPVGQPPVVLDRKVPAITEKTTAEVVQEQVVNQAIGGTTELIDGAGQHVASLSDLLSNPLVLLAGAGVALWLLTRGK